MRESEWEAMRRDILRRGVEVDAARQALKDANLAAQKARHLPDSPPMIAFRAADERRLRAEAEAFPPGFWDDVERLKRKDPAGLRTTLPFLDADPWFHRSGYAKARLVRYLRNVELTREQSDRVRDMLIKVVKSRDRAKFEDYCKLARKVDTLALRAQLAKCMKSDRLDVRRRAQWMLDALNGRAIEWRLLPSEKE